MVVACSGSGGKCSLILPSQHCLPLPWQAFHTTWPGGEIRPWVVTLSTSISVTPSQSSSSRAKAGSRGIQLAFSSQFSTLAFAAYSQLSLVRFVTTSCCLRPFCIKGFKRFAKSRQQSKQQWERMSNDSIDCCIHSDSCPWAGMLLLPYPLHAQLLESGLILFS